LRPADFDPSAGKQRRKRVVLAVGFREVVGYHHFLLVISFYIIAKSGF